MNIYHISSLNKNLFLFINNLSIHGGFLNSVNIFIALYSPFLLALLLAVIYLSGIKEESLYAFYTALSGLLINFAIGFLYFHSRPFAIGLGHPLIQHAKDSSFPSDHATIAFSIAFGFLAFRRKFIGFLCLIFALMVGFARVYVGVHFPYDIFGSFFVSLFSIAVVYVLKNPLRRVNKFLINIQLRLWKL